ncbi:MAG: D-glycero-beta-D-manno-heptose-7-phosphate kinase, partial [Gammaproteobacteria bacterium]|nr:D-glycero-beta-D-manno-heptose-7-phosphate kinase [Gammaproteobacteria bacterium]
MRHTLKQVNLPDFTQSRIIVFGDLMLDRYWHGDTTRISPEAPVPIVKVQDCELRPGGAANVALNIAALGAQIELFGIVGNDSEAVQLREILESKGVTCHFLTVEDQPTITKLRVIGRNQQLIRMDFEEGFHQVNLDTLMQQYQQRVAQADAVILSDYAKGSLTQITKLIELAQQHQKPVLVDPKETAITYYRGATLLTPNRKEFETMVGICDTQEAMVARAQDVIAKADLQALLITLGKDGMLLVTADQEPYHIPTRAQQVYDVTGAGDTVIAVFATTLAAQADMQLATYVANAAAGIVVAKVGSATVTAAELRRALKKQNTSQLGVIQQTELLHLIEDVKASGEKIVMTNGCFDILHSGHV